jgi:hypothetical protein
MAVIGVKIEYPFPFERWRIATASASNIRVEKDQK